MIDSQSMRRTRVITAGLLASSLVPAVIAAEPLAAPEDATAWKSSAAVGVTLTSGNSDTLMVNGSLLTGKKWDQNELAFGANFTYGEDSDQVNASSAGGFGQYNRLFTERLYGFLRLDALHDDIAKIDYRVSLSPGIGYYLLKDDKFTLALEAGPGYVFERLDGHEQDYLTLRFGERFTWKINDRARLWQMFDYQPRAEEWSDYVLNAEIGIETDITKSLSLRVAAMDTYRSVPAAGREENDFKLIAGVAYKF